MADTYEYHLFSQYPTQKMAVPFTPEIVFVYNISNAWLYLNTTTYAIPTATAYDMSIPPNSYVIFIPYTPNTEYGGLLQVTGGGAIEWDCWIEFRRGYSPNHWEVTPSFPVIQSLTPMPSIAVVPSFTFQIIDPYPVPIATYYGDSLIDSLCIVPISVSTNCGFVAGTTLINSGGEWGNASARAERLTPIRCWGIGVRILPCAGETWTGVTEIRVRFQWTVYGGGFSGIGYDASVNGVPDFFRDIVPAQGYADGNWYEIIFPLTSVANPVTDLEIGLWNDSGASNFPQTFTIDRIYVFGTSTP